MLIVESISAEKKRFPAYGNEKIISLADIAMYTNDAAFSFSLIDSSTSRKGVYDIILYLKSGQFHYSGIMLTSAHALLYMKIYSTGRGLLYII